MFCKIKLLKSLILKTSILRARGILCCLDSKEIFVVRTTKNSLLFEQQKTRFYDFTTLRIYGFTDLWIYGFTDLRIYGFTDLRIYGFMDLRIVDIC